VRIAVEAVRRFRAGDRPYAGQVFSGPESIAPEAAGGKGFMGMGVKSLEEDQQKAARKQIYQDIYDSVMEFDGNRCTQLVKDALAAGEPVQDILDQGLIPPMGRVGDLFAAGEFFVPEMLMAAKAMKAGLEVLKPILTQRKSKPKGTVVMATVFGDLHDIGKNLVGMMLEGAGFKVVDLGVNTKAEKIIEIAKQVNADVIGLSALLTTTMPFMKLIIEKIKQEGLNIPVIVGGAPVTREFAKEVGADGYGDNAPEAVEVCLQLVTGAAKAAA
jgi:5-methyltetrahydrofolate--homocysteine methyltransferase